MKFSIYGIISRIPAGMIQAAFLSAAFIVAGNSESAAQSAGVEGILESHVPVSPDSLDFTKDDFNASTAQFLSDRKAGDTLTVSYDTIYYTNEYISNVSSGDYHLQHLSDKTVSETVTDVKLKSHYGLVRTNLVGDAVLIPNIGGEIAITDNWSLGADFYLQWLKDRDKDKFYQTYMLDVSARYWFNGTKKRNDGIRPFSGWHIGPYGQAVTYDWENGNKGYQSRVFFWTFGAGCEGGYNFPVGKNRRWAFDFYVGIGYFHTKYNVYYPDYNRHYYFDHRQCKNFFGPTRIGVSLNYIIK